MGLAASQGRMILLVQNRINCQYKLMDLSNQQLRNLDEQDLIADKYDQMATAAVYSYQYNDDIKLEDFTYSDLMGKNAIANGREAIMITDTMGRVVLDNRYAAALTMAKSINGKLELNDKCFNAFVSALEGNEFNWFEYKDKQAVTEEIIVPNNVNTTDRYIPYGEDTKEYKNWKTLCDNIVKYGTSFINTYGEEPPYVNTSPWGTTMPPATPAEDYHDILPTYNDDRPGNHYTPSRKVNDDDYNYQIWMKGWKKNSKNKTYPVWTEALTSAASKAKSTYSQMYDYVKNGSLPPQPRKANPNYGGESKTEDVVVTPLTTEEQTIKNTAKYYWTIFSACVKNGKENFVVDDTVCDRTTLNAKLYNGTYNINGNNIRNDERATFKKARDNADEYEEIKNQEKKELAKLERVEKRISSEKEKVQTQLSAIETEINSVQSIITKNIERGFTYCQNG